MLWKCDIDDLVGSIHAQIIQIRICYIADLVGLSDLQVILYSHAVGRSDEFLKDL